MRLCYVCDEYPPVVRNFGGIGVVFQMEAEWMARRGHEVFVAGFAEDREKRRLRINGVNVILMRRGACPKLRALTDRFRIGVLAGRLLREKEGILVAADYSGPLVWKGGRHPLVVQMHGAGVLNARLTGKEPNWKTMFFESRTVSMATAVRAVSRFTARETCSALNCYPGWLEIIPNPFDPIGFLDRGRRSISKEILFVGKLNTRTKGVDILFRAVVPVMRAIPEATLTIVGHDGKEQGRLVSEQCLELVPAAYHPRVRFLGRLKRREVAEAMRKAAVLVVPSRIEAFPMSIMEAMAAGLPVVASRRGGIPEMVVDGVTGLLADPEEPESFSKAILRVLLEDDLSERLARAAREEAERHHSPDFIFSKLEGLYREVVSYR